MSARLRRAVWIISDQVIPFEFDVPYEIETAPGRVLITSGDDVLVAPEVEVVHSFPANAGDPLPFDFTEILLEGEAGSWPFLADGASQIGIADHARTVIDNDT